LAKLVKLDYLNQVRNHKPDAFEMAVISCTEENKAMRARKEKHNNNESNAWALIYDQCAPKRNHQI
jgi:hypothetical protein